MRVRAVLAILGMCLLATVSVVRVADAGPIPPVNVNCTAQPASCQSLTLNGQWTIVDDGGMNVIIPLDSLIANGNILAWTWNSPSAVSFSITDLFTIGDGFDVFDNNTFVGEFNNGKSWTDVGPACVTAGEPTMAVCDETDDPNVAFTDPLFNHGTILFAPGSHSITIESIARPLEVNGQTMFPDATVAFNATTVPEPFSLALLGTGLAFGALRRRMGKRS